MATTPITLDLAPETLAALDEIAANTETDRATVLREAVDLYLADYATEKAELAQADREIEALNMIPHDEVVAWFHAQHPQAKTAEAA